MLRGQREGTGSFLPKQPVLQALVQDVQCLSLRQAGPCLLPFLPQSLQFPCNF